MSTMNILIATLIILILAAGMALFFGVRAAQAGDVPALALQDAVGDVRGGLGGE